MVPTRETSVTGLAAEIAEQGELDGLRSVSRRLARQLAASKAKTADLIEAVYQGARDANTLLGPVAPVVAPPKDKRKAGVEVALAHGTDWQYGKITSVFNRQVLRERIQQYADKILRVTEIQRADHPVKRCVLFLGGDMLEGVTVFPNQAWGVDASLNDQIFEVARLEEELARTLATTFDQVDVYVVPGNHGRLGKPGDFPAQDNADAIAYRIAAERNTDPRIAWHLPELWYQIVPIGNYRALLVHGDQIRGFGGNLPSYGIVKRVSAWASGVLEPFDAAYMGHFHTFQTFAMFDGRPIYIGNTPESGNEYAREFIAATGHPSQRLQFVDPHRGRVTADYQVFLDG